jgi:hypothetical protein
MAGRVVRALLRPKASKNCQDPPNKIITGDFINPFRPTIWTKLDCRKYKFTNIYLYGSVECQEFDNKITIINRHSYLLLVWNVSGACLHEKKYCPLGILTNFRNFPI